MLIRTRRRVVEEQVTEVVSHDSFEARVKQRPERMNYEHNRLDSLESLLFDDDYNFDISIKHRLAKAGFYESCCNTVCFWCGLDKDWRFWLEDHDPETVHRKESPDCEFVTGQSDNVPIGDMKYEQNRLDSFSSWWLDSHHLPVSVTRRLAKEGIYYSSYGGYTECFSCELRRTRSFRREDHDPEKVHRKESPNCLFVTGKSDNVPINNELQENSKTSTDISGLGASQPRGSQISKRHTYLKKIQRLNNQITIKPSYIMEVNNWNPIQVLNQNKSAKKKIQKRN